MSEGLKKNPEFKLSLNFIFNLGYKERTSLAKNVYNVGIKFSYFKYNVVTKVGYFDSFLVSKKKNETLNF